MKPIKKIAHFQLQASVRLYEYKYGDLTFYFNERLPQGIRIRSGRAKFTKNYYVVGGALAKELKRKDTPVSNPIKKVEAPSEAAETHQSLKQTLADFEQKIFGTKITKKALNDLKKTKPELVKEHNRLKREVVKAYDHTRKMIFFESKTELLEAQDYRERMEKMGVESRVDPNFLGMVNSMGHFFTPAGKRLPGLIGKKVAINPDYDPEKDDTYYCKSVNINGNIQTHYTEDYFVRKKKQKYVKNLDFGKALEEIRGRLSEDIKSKDKIKQTMALMVHLVDQAYFRIGNAKSEQNGVFGLHNLRVRHIKIEGNRVYFDYIGKDKIHQKQVVECELASNLISDLIKGKGSEDSVFTISGKLITPEMINFYLKKELKSPVTIHKFRTYHATRLAREFLEKVSVSPPPNEGKLMEFFKKSMESIAEKMGHTSSNTTIKHYIDSNILISFFERYQIEPPKVLSKVASFIRGLYASSSPVFKLNEFFDLTISEIEFNSWMEALPESVLEKTVRMDQTEEGHDE